MKEKKKEGDMWCLYEDRKGECIYVVCFGLDPSYMFVILME